MAILSDLGSCSLETLLTGGAAVGGDRARESKVKLFREKVIVANWPDGTSSGREGERVVGEDRGSISISGDKLVAQEDGSRTGRGSEDRRGLSRRGRK